MVNRSVRLDYCANTKNPSSEEAADVLFLLAEQDRGFVGKTKNLRFCQRQAVFVYAYLGLHRSCLTSHLVNKASASPLYPVLHHTSSNHPDSTAYHPLSLQSRHLPPSP